MKYLLWPIVLPIHCVVWMRKAWTDSTARTKSECCNALLTVYYVVFGILAMMVITETPWYVSILYMWLYFAGIYGIGMRITYWKRVWNGQLRGGDKS